MASVSYIGVTNATTVIEMSGTQIPHNKWSFLALSRDVFIPHSLKLGGMLYSPCLYVRLYACPSARDPCVRSVVPTVLDGLFSYIAQMTTGEI